MFKKLASDALGISDIGKIIKPGDYDKTDADDYVMHEDGEKIYFLIKSKADEYCFTNLALIHVDGANAVSKKRTLRRYSYHESKVSDVFLETAGTVDLDVEIKFTLGNNSFSIDIYKEHLEELKDLYKALIAINEIMNSNDMLHQNAKESLSIASSVLGHNRSNENALADQFAKINEYSFSWLKDAKDNYQRKDYGTIFEKYINN